MPRPAIANVMNGGHKKRDERDGGAHQVELAKSTASQELRHAQSLDGIGDRLGQPAIFRFFMPPMTVAIRPTRFCTAAIQALWESPVNWTSADRARKQRATMTMGTAKAAPSFPYSSQLARAASIQAAHDSDARWVVST